MDELARAWLEQHRKGFSWRLAGPPGRWDPAILREPIPPSDQWSLCFDWRVRGDTILWIEHGWWDHPDDIRQHAWTVKHAERGQESVLFLVAHNQIVMLDDIDRATDDWRRWQGLTPAYQRRPYFGEFHGTFTED